MQSAYLIKELLKIPAHQLHHSARYNQYERSTEAVQRMIRRKICSGSKWKSISSDATFYLEDSDMKVIYRKRF